jgi:prepilin-type N-terminal cleavage/methylation domain-containing protein
MARSCFRSHRSGFSLLELTVALALLTGVVLALGEVIAAAARAARAARDSTWSTVLAAQKIEQVRALAWGYDPSGVARTDVVSDLARWPDATADGRGLTPSPGDSLSANIDGFVDYFDGAGAWLGCGRSPPGRTVFVRRWSITPAGWDPAATLVIRVRVLRRGSPAGLGPPDPADIQLLDLVSVRTRRAN